MLFTITANCQAIKGNSTIGRDPFAWTNFIIIPTGQYKKLYRPIRKEQKESSATKAPRHEESQSIKIQYIKLCVNLESLCLGGQKILFEVDSRINIQSVSQCLLKEIRQ
jgi:hypothetical protein